MRSSLPFVLASFLLLAGCGARIEPASTGCPPPNPGLCAPSMSCENGVRRTGQASCVDGNWVCAEEACDDAGTDADACDGTPYLTCLDGRIVSTCCPSNAFCLQNDYCDLGGGACTPGVCADAGACSGYVMPYCDATGHIQSFCCPAGANCSPPPVSCAHADGTCTLGECPFDGGADACASISASSYDRACATDADCVAVYEGALCGACRCMNAAIAKVSLADYEKDVTASHPGPSTCTCTRIPSPVCRAGACSMP